MESLQQQLKEKFFNKTLSVEERALFAEQMATDKAYAEDIAFELQLRRTLIAKKQWFPTIKQTTKNGLLPYYYVLAAILIGLSIVGLIKYKAYKKEQELMLSNKIQEIETLKKQKEQAIIDSIELINKLQRDFNKKQDPSVIFPKKSDTKEIKSSKDSIKKPIDIVASNVEEAQFINTNILEIAKKGYSQTASSSNSIPQKKKWLSLFDDLEKTKFKDVTVAQIKGVLKEAEIDFKTVNEETVSENAVFKFVLLNMLVKPPTKTQKQSLDKWLIKFTPNQFTDEQEKYWQEMKNAYKN